MRKLERGAFCCQEIDRRRYAILMRFGQFLPPNAELIRILNLSRHGGGIPSVECCQGTLPLRHSVPNADFPLTTAPAGAAPIAFPAQETKLTRTIPTREEAMGYKIAVMGTGAVGAYAGAHMARAGEDITFIDPWPANVEKMKADGLKVSHIRDVPEWSTPVRA